ncbi:MAG: ribulose-phosphate 3-epimerase [Oscillospiraceae bacterium]|nr:ribulose-phosphate 3-epimerase [Oscillospiraceae bacterium]
MAEVSTSILTVKQEDAIKTFYDLETAGTTYFHIDIMDGKFVPKNTEEMMYEYSSTIKQISNLPLDVHLMVEDVRDNIEKYIPLTPHIITIHYEACKDDDEVFELLGYIKDNNIKAGISIKPGTEAEKIKKFLPHVYLVLVMTVEPGLGGQKLMPSTVEKVRELKEYIDKEGLDTYIEVDGGVNLETVHLVKEAGAEILVAGSAIIDAKDFKEMIGELAK